MPAKLKRNYPRRHVVVPIIYSDRQRDHTATMCNASVDGMYFETLLPLEPGDKISIKMENDTPDIYYSPEAFDVKPAKVRWCNRLSGSDNPAYGVGIQYC